MAMMTVSFPYQHGEDDADDATTWMMTIAGGHLAPNYLD